MGNFMRQDRANHILSTWYFMVIKTNKTAILQYFSFVLAIVCIHFWDLVYVLFENPGNKSGCWYWISSSGFKKIQIHHTTTFMVSFLKNQESVAKWILEKRSICIYIQKNKALWSTSQLVGFQNRPLQKLDFVFFFKPEMQKQKIDLQAQVKFFSIKFFWH